MRSFKITPERLDELKTLRPSEACLTRTEVTELISAYSHNNGYRIFKDGNEWCAVGPHFVNLQESDSGFGETPMIALAELMTLEDEKEIQHICVIHGLTECPRC